MKAESHRRARFSSPAPKPNSRTRLASTTRAASPSWILPSGTPALNVKVSTVRLIALPLAPAPRKGASGRLASSANRSPIMWPMSCCIRFRR